MSLKYVSPCAGTHVVVLVWFSPQDTDTGAGSTASSCRHLPIESCHLSGNKWTKALAHLGCQGMAECKPVSVLRFSKLPHYSWCAWGCHCFSREKSNYRLNQMKARYRPRACFSFGENADSGSRLVARVSLFLQAWENERLSRVFLHSSQFGLV